MVFFDADLNIQIDWCNELGFFIAGERLAVVF
jgi:hypothetical protein